MAPAEGYEDTALRLLEEAEQRLDQANPDQVIALAHAWATLAVHERLGAIEFQLSQMPRG